MLEIDLESGSAANQVQTPNFLAKSRGRLIPRRIQGTPLLHAPKRDPILSFSHTLLPKSTHVRRWPPPKWEILDPQLTTTIDKINWLQ